MKPSILGVLSFYVANVQQNPVDISFAILRFTVNFQLITAIGSPTLTPRQSTREGVKNNSPKTSRGQFIDPNTGKPIEEGQEVLGHKRGQEWSKYKRDPANQNKTRKEVIEDQNNPDIYQIEDKKL